MREFIDSTGESWSFEINISTIKQLNAALAAGGYDIDLLESTNVLIRLANVIVAADILFLLVRSTAESRNVSAEEFGSRLRGDILFHARQALIEEYIDFFPEANVRESLRTFARASDKLAAESRRLIAARTEQIVQEATLQEEIAGS